MYNTAFYLHPPVKATYYVTQGVLIVGRTTCKSRPTAQTGLSGPDLFPMGTGHTTPLYTIPPYYEHPWCRHSQFQTHRSPGRYVTLYERRTRFHEVALRTVGAVVEDLMLNQVVFVIVAADERLAGPLSAVVVTVSLLDPPVYEETQHVRSQVERQDDEVEQIVVVQQVDA